MKKHEHHWKAGETPDAYFCDQCGYSPAKGWRSYWIPGTDCPVDAVLPVIILGGSAFAALVGTFVLTRSA
jgi:hypothetical protein